MFHWKEYLKLSHSDNTDINCSLSSAPKEVVKFHFGKMSSKTTVAVVRVSSGCGSNYKSPLIKISINK